MSKEGLSRQIEGLIKRRETLVYGGKIPQELLGELVKSGVEIDEEARGLLESPGFKASPTETSITVATFQLMDLLKDTDVLIAWALGTEKDVDEQGRSVPYSKGIIPRLGLDFVPPDAALEYALQKLQKRERLLVWMRPIAPEGSSLMYMFYLEKDDQSTYVGGQTTMPFENLKTEYSDPVTRIRASVLVGLS